MAEIEVNFIIMHKDKNGRVLAMHPITKAENVLGIEAFVNGIVRKNPRNNQIHIRWKMSEASTELLSEPADYIGIANTSSETAPTNPTEYTWYRYKGENGTNGKDGIIGKDGIAATISIGTVTTGAAGTNATVTNVGTENAAVLNFVIPKGDRGETGNEATSPSGGTIVSEVAPPGDSNMQWINPLNSVAHYWHNDAWHPVVGTAL